MSIGRSVCHNFKKKRREVTLPCSYRSTCSKAKGSTRSTHMHLDFIQFVKQSEVKTQRGMFRRHIDGICRPYFRHRCRPNIQPFFSLFIASAELTEPKSLSILFLIYMCTFSESRESHVGQIFFLLCNIFPPSIQQDTYALCLMTGF